VKSVTVIIPTLNGEEKIELILKSLKEQTKQPLEIIIVDSSSTDKTVELARKEGAKIISIARDSFNHGETRNLAAKESKGDYLLYMTQDAIPYDIYTIENLLSGITENKEVVASFAQQIANPYSTEREKLIRAYNYPSESKIKSMDDASELGIKTYFLSDVCAMYEKQTFFKLNGFEAPIETNEDMHIASKILRMGKKIRYEANAKVYHSHDSSFKEIFIRNYFIGKFLKKYKDDFPHSATNKEGMNLVKKVTSQLFQKGLIGECILFWIECGIKLFGNLAGKLTSVR
jgi:rhamnosyltransferase